jgi:hypothetical protein
VAFTPTDPESDAALKAAFPLHRSELPHIPLIQNGERCRSPTLSRPIRKPDDLAVSAVGVASHSRP